MANKAQRDLIFSKIGHTPTAAQEKIHDSLARVRLVAGGERSGKSKSAAADLTSRLFEGKLFWLTAADYERTRAEFDYIIEHLVKLGIKFSATKHVDPGEIEIEGGIRIATKSAKDPRKLAMEAPDGILVCEASQVDFETFLRVRGRVMERRGWVLLSGCLAGESLIFTEQGILPIEQLVGQITHPINLGVFSSGIVKKADLAWYNGAGKSIKLELHKGFKLEGTPNHKVVTNRGWVELQNLTAEDKVAIPYGQDLWGKKLVSNDLAYLAGLYIAEGCWDSKYNRISIASKEPEVIELFEKRGFVYSPKTFQLRKTDHELAKAFEDLGIERTWKAKNKEVPQGIMQANKEAATAFLQGLFDGDGCAASEGRVTLDTISEKLARQVHMLLLNLGIVATLAQRKDKCWVVYTSESQNYSQIVGFGLPRKQKVLLNFRATRNRTFLGGKKDDWGTLNNQKVFWAKVLRKQEGFCQSYDLSVPVTHMYCANGIWVHNTFESSLGWY